jgi:hypothetical protein
MIPQHYAIQPGALFGGEYPGDKMREVARARLLSLVDIGVRTFIDLTTPADLLVPYEESLAPLGLETDTQLRRIPMPVLDMGVPDIKEMRGIMEAIRDSIDAGPAVYIHCWGGIGRTGTVVGCWLRETGLGGEEALERVQHLYATHMPKVSRHPESPQTTAQKNFIRCWKSVADKGINL